jgi:hypothetical protein
MVSEVKHDAEYRNSASATAGKNIRLGCHIRFVAGVSMPRASNTAIAFYQGTQHIACAPAEKAQVPALPASTV